MILRFKSFILNENKTDLKCDILDSYELDNLIKKILNFDDNDYESYLNNLEIFIQKFKYLSIDNYDFNYVVLYDDTNIYGIIKFKQTIYEEDNVKGYGIWSASINKDFIGKGYSKMLIEKLFIHCNKNKMALYPSYFSMDGYNRIRLYFSEFEKKYNVEVFYYLGLKTYLRKHLLNDLKDTFDNVTKINDNHYIIKNIHVLISDTFLDKENLIDDNKKYILVEVNRNDTFKNIDKPNIIKHIRVFEPSSIPYNLELELQNEL